MRDIWIKAVHKRVRSYLSDKLKISMEKIAKIYRVLVDFKAIIVSLHKEFSLDANYPKGHGTIFHKLFLENHAGEFLFHTESFGDARKNSSKFKQYDRYAN